MSEESSARKSSKIVFVTNFNDPKQQNAYSQAQLVQQLFNEFNLRASAPFGGTNLRPYLLDTQNLRVQCEGFGDHFDPDWSYRPAIPAVIGVPANGDNAEIPAAAAVPAFEGGAIVPKHVRTFPDMYPLGNINAISASQGISLKLGQERDLDIIQGDQAMKEAVLNALPNDDIAKLRSAAVLADHLMFWTAKKTMAYAITNYGIVTAEKIDMAVDAITVPLRPTDFISAKQLILAVEERASIMASIPVCARPTFYSIRVEVMKMFLDHPAMHEVWNDLFRSIPVIDHGWVTLTKTITKVYDNQLAQQAAAISQWFMATVNAESQPRLHWKLRNVGGASEAVDISLPNYVTNAIASAAPAGKTPPRHTELDCHLHLAGMTCPRGAQCVFPHAKANHGLLPSLKPLLLTAKAFKTLPPDVQQDARRAVTSGGQAPASANRFQHTTSPGRSLGKGNGSGSGNNGQPRNNRGRGAPHAAAAGNNTWVNNKGTIAAGPMSAMSDDDCDD